jgi:hypothetical protein
MITRNRIFFKKNICSFLRKGRTCATQEVCSYEVMLEAVQLRPTELLSSLQRVAALHHEVADADDIPSLLRQLTPVALEGLNLDDAMRRVDDAANIVRGVDRRRAIRDGSKRIFREESDGARLLHLEEQSVFDEIRCKELLEVEGLYRAFVVQEQQQFQHFAETNEPAWRMSAAQQTDARKKRERERRLTEVTHALINMEEDARQDKHQWFQEARDWFAAVKFTEEDERHSVSRRIQRRDDDAAIAAALQAASMPMPSRAGTSGSQPPRQQQQQQQQQQHPSYGYARPNANPGVSPSAYPQYSYGFGSTAPQAPAKGPAGYPAYGAASSPYSNAPSTHQQNLYDPYRLHGQQTNQGNNYGIAQQPAGFGGPPPPNTRPQQQPANQYTTPPANIFYGRY